MKLPPFLLKTMLAALLSVCMAATLISWSPNSTETTETQQQTPSDSSEQTQDPADTDGNDTQDQQSAEDLRPCEQCGRICEKRAVTWYADAHIFS